MSQPVNENGAAKNLTGTAAVSTGPCQLIGFYVNSTSAGVLNLKDGGSGGAALCGSITPAIGFHRFPATVGSSLYFTLVSGSIDITFFFASGN